MCRPSSSIRIAGWLIGGLAAVSGPSCGTSSRPDPRHYLPDARDARRAVEGSLEAWRNSPQLERTIATIRPVMFVDQQRQPGQRLREFAVLGESAGVEGYRHFRVKLSLEGPDESRLVSYYVFGQGPIWVYRAEDFDMIMHMDKSMMAAPPPAADASGPEDGSRAEPGRRHPVPPSEATEETTGSRPRLDD